MAKSLELSEFQKISGPIFDVRSPGEFAQGQLPGAYNLPLFTNEERSQIGSLYKQIGRKQAVLEGMRYAAPKFAHFVEEVEKALQDFSPEGKAKIHCWRGGMRSGSVAMLLEMAGMPTVTLKGGYKAFRHWALESLKQPYQLRILGGMTGSGKTAILHFMKAQGTQVLDLEGFAKHRGSSFGMIGMPQQPSNEQFENELGFQLSLFDPKRPIWIEDESRLIGWCKVPDPLFLAMRTAPLYILERSTKHRLEEIQKTYWDQDPNALIKSTNRLIKKLGSVRGKEAVAAIEKKDMETATLIILEYYDRSYLHELRRHKRPQIQLDGSHRSNELWATYLGSLH
ncbi:MAG: tRNA 2-selenouridine(34) synthase MnmH [Parachlamydiaceae bacterium]|nr:tRNA 2-selenouridine(34) synthase MnmH [Parachlamydiaceae bacterium]